MTFLLRSIQQVQHKQWRVLIQPSIRAFSSNHQTTLKDSYDNILVERKVVEATTNVSGGNIGIITLNRPKALNALSDALFTDLIHAANALDNDPSIGSLIITGSLKAFAAGADISEMKNKSYDETYQNVSRSSIIPYHHLKPKGKPKMGFLFVFCLHRFLLFSALFLP